ncbi:dihydrofolate reductase family protein [Georgenia halophila]|uniref:Dihydrofolate reductase family protein n=1 Tax=Georgenia halophila TaxID=620889 RepID=A0ABP8LDL8_9MICO
MNGSTGRRVVTNISLTLDGFYHGPGGPGDLSAIVPYAVTETARDHLTRLWEPATTVLLGRGNAEGFMGYWPAVADDESADPRDRGFARWLVETEKVVLSSTLTEAPWERTRVRNAPAADVVAELRSEGDGDILVASSPSVITSLLAADVVDRFSLIMCPEIVGGGTRLLENRLPGSRWALARHEAGERGELSLAYDRVG